MDELHKPLLKSLKKADSGDFLLKKAALNKSVKKLMKAKDYRMVSRCHIQLPMVSNGETEPHLLAGDNGSLVFYANLVCEAKERSSNSVQFGKGLLKI